MSEIVAKRYAKALFELSLEAKTSETVYNDLKLAATLISDSCELNEFLNNSSIPCAKRKTILAKLFKRHVNSLTYQFILFLNMKWRLAILNDVCHAFESLYLDSQNISKVRIISGIKLNKHQVDEISLHLQSRLGKNIEPHLIIDSKMVGGVKIQEGDTIYDYSLRTQLEKFKKNLIKA